MSAKVYAYGMDGFVLPMMKKFAGEGALPHFGRLLQQGAANQTRPSFPVWTPTNWATLSTGAHTGTHEVSTWQTTLADGSEVDSFDGRANNADRIWNALERAGLEAVAMHYPGAHPSGVDGGFVLDGFGHPGHAKTEFEVAACQAYVTDPADAGGVTMGHDGSAVEGPQAVELVPALQPAAGWAGLPDSAQPPLATSIAVVARVGADRTELHLLVTDAGGRGYDTVRVCRARDGDSAIATASTGGWSDWAIEPFRIDGGERRAAVRFKLLRLEPDGSALKLYRSQVTYTEGFSYGHTELEAELLERIGPYQEHASMTPYTSGMADFDTVLEECEYQGLWFAAAANIMLWEKGCSYFTCHWHLYDYLNHIHLADVDPACPAFEERRAEEVTDYFRRAYQVGDRVVERMYAAVDDHSGEAAYVGVLADHGAVPDIRVANIRKFLHERGFLVLNGGAELVATDSDRMPADAIDWDKTRAYLKRRGFDITINAEPGSAEFDQIERDLLRALRTWVDEETGTTPVAIALPRRDAYLLDQWGDQCGDVVFAWDHGYVSGYYPQWQAIVGGGSAGAPEVFGAHHGGFLPTDNGYSSSYGSFLIAGPGIKAGYERPPAKLGYIHAADVVPTLCHLLQVPPPEQAQGTVARDLFVDHEMVRPRPAAKG